MISKVKIAATALGAIALIGVWQAGSYNQAKQEKWNNAVPQVSENANQIIQPQPVVENQTEHGDGHQDHKKEKERD